MERVRRGGAFREHRRSRRDVCRCGYYRRVGSSSPASHGSKEGRSRPATAEGGVASPRTYGRTSASGVVVVTGAPSSRGQQRAPQLRDDFRRPESGGGGQARNGTTTSPERFPGRCFCLRMRRRCLSAVADCASVDVCVYAKSCCSGSRARTQRGR
ncbi:hypothetical protein MRX96_012828 [Rhipicephalus microplus]